MENENPIINPANEIMPPAFTPAPVPTPTPLPEKPKYTFNKNHLFLGVAVLAVVITGILLLGKAGLLDLGSDFSMKSSQAVAEEALKYINENVIVKGKTAVLVSATEESGVIKMSIKVDENADDIYVTRDGKIIFLQEVKVPAK